MIVDASSIRTGGGIQVLLSFLNYIKISHKRKLILIIHKDFYETTDLSFEHFKRIIIIKSKFHLLYINLFYFFSKCNVLQVFGPSYLFLPFCYKITGFANPWIAFPNSIAYKNYGHFKFFLYKVKYKILELLFLFNSDVLHVENPLLKDVLKSSLLKNKEIFVINNAISNNFKSSAPDSFKSYLNNFNDDGFRYFSYVTSDYPHKQLDLIPKLCEIFNANSDFKIKCFVTLPKSTYDSKSEKFKKHTVNLGYLKPNECRVLLEHVDFCYFPTLLECFSAGFIEPLYTNTPLFVSDFNFVRSILLDLPIYIDPLDLNDQVNKILIFYKHGFKYQYEQLSLVLNKYSDDTMRNESLLRFLFF